MQSSWKRLRRNKGAVAGLLVIALAVLLSISAYLIAPDHTPDANRMVLEIEGQHPGFRTTMLAVKKEREVPAVSFFQQLLHGQESDVTWIPVRSCHFSDSGLVIQRYGVFNPYTGRGAIKGLLPHDPHNVRDVLATHILKHTGSYEQASYAIQDTPEMVAKHYGRFLPQDKAAMAARILNQVWEAA